MDGLARFGKVEMRKEERDEPKWNGIQITTRAIALCETNSHMMCEI
jgi:hypothetical protein